MVIFMRAATVSPILSRVAINRIAIKDRGVASVGIGDRINPGLRRVLLEEVAMNRQFNALYNGEGIYQVCLCIANVRFLRIIYAKEGSISYDRKSYRWRNMYWCLVPFRDFGR